MYGSQFAYDMAEEPEYPDFDEQDEDEPDEHLTEDELDRAASEAESRWKA